MLLKPLTFNINVLVLSSENTWQEPSSVTVRFVIHRQCTDRLFLRDAPIGSTQPIRWHTQTSQSPTSGVRVIGVQQKRPHVKGLAVVAV